MNSNISPNTYAQKQIADFAGMSSLKQPQIPVVSRTSAYTLLPVPEFPRPPGLPDDWDNLINNQSAIDKWR